jgi:hypothetical protein
MSFLNRAEDWLIRKLMTPIDFNYGMKPVGRPPSDDGFLALLMLGSLLLITAITCGHCLAR